MSQPVNSGDREATTSEEIRDAPEELPRLPPRPLSITLTKPDADSSSVERSRSNTPELGYITDYEHNERSNNNNNDNNMPADIVPSTQVILPEDQVPPPLPERRELLEPSGGDNEDPSLLSPTRTLSHKKSYSSDMSATERASAVETEAWKQTDAQRRASLNLDRDSSKRAVIANAIRRKFGSLSSNNLVRGSILRNTSSQNSHHDATMKSSLSSTSLSSDIPMSTGTSYGGNIVTNMPMDWPSTDWPSNSPITSPLVADFSQKDLHHHNDADDDDKSSNSVRASSEFQRRYNTASANGSTDTLSQLRNAGKHYMDIWAKLASPFGGKLDYETALDLDLALSHYANSMRARYALSMIGFAVLVWFGFYYNISIWLLAGALACWIYVLRRSDSSDAVIWSHLVELERGNRLLGRRSESVEWVNHVVGKLWPLINRDLFAPAIDLMEDVLKQQCPSIVYAVRVDDVDQGVYPFRVRSIRVLPPSKDLSSVSNANAFADGIHLEAEFIYQAAPAANQQQESRNAHMICMLTMGVKGVAGVTVPAFAELLTCVGTCRVRLQPSADPPFVRLGNFTFMRRPRIDISVKPLRTINIMNLPLISDYILRCVNIVVDQFVWPKSYTLDIGKLILGDDMPHNSATVGVVCVTFHSAKGLRNADVLGKSDAYATMSLHQNGKTRFRTRILNNELNPIWEETGFMLVSQDDLRNQEVIRLQVWDADRWNSDDALGSVEVPLSPLVSNPGVMKKHTSPLTDINHENENNGELTYSIGYYKKVASRKGTSKYPTGILSVLVHEGADIELRTTPRDASPEDVSAFGVPASVRYSNTGGGSSSSNNIFPSSYVELVINDELTYRSRVKPTNPRPYWNCLTDRVIRDWHNCRIRIVIRDSRSREHDPVLGVVALELGDLMKQIPDGQSMEIMRWYRLLGGIGYGKIRLSLVFHPIDITIPRHLSGYNVGTLHVSHICATDLSGLAEGMPIYCRLSLSSDDNNDAVDTEVTKLIQKDVTPLPVPAMTMGSLASTLLMEARWPGSEVVLPVNARYTSALIIQLRQRKLRREVVAFGVVWLKDLVDGEAVAADIPIFMPGDIRPFERDIGPQSHAVNLHTAAHDTIKAAIGTDKSLVERFVGHVRFNIVFKGGIADEHRKAKRGNTFLQRAMEVHDIVHDENLSNTASMNPSYEDLNQSVDMPDNSGDYQASIAKQPEQDHRDKEREEEEEEEEEAREAGTGTPSRSDSKSNRSSSSSGDIDHRTPSDYSRESNELGDVDDRFKYRDDDNRLEEVYGGDGNMLSSSRASLSNESVRRKQLREQIGPMKHKGVRTLKWAKDKLDESGHKVKHLLRPRHREHSNMMDAEG
ncbi:hypothetical protein BDF22DRAFT_668911 [Syncephalis plumigaleata]|nr:hypothetical protein BDF22DRAFT_668911 [Syncephalis plumigaleata]